MYIVYSNDETRAIMMNVEDQQLVSNFSKRDYCSFVKTVLGKNIHYYRSSLGRVYIYICIKS